MIHVSFFPVDKFYPRVPMTRLNGEDGVIPRICFSDGDIEDAVNGIPDALKIIAMMQELGVNPTLFVYELDDFEAVNSVDSKPTKEGYPRVLMYPDTAEYVPDADLTGECWVLDDIPDDCISLSCYEITNYEAGEDAYLGRQYEFPLLSRLCLKKVDRPVDNVSKLLGAGECRYSAEYRKVTQFIKKGRETSFLRNLSEVLLELRAKGKVIDH